MADIATVDDLTKSVTLPKDDLSEAVFLLTRIQDGDSLEMAASALGVSISTAYRRLRMIEVDNDGVVKLLQAHSLRLVGDWMTASKEAAKKGDHRPAKDALLHAKAIEPVVDSSQGGSGVTIIIGTPEQPIRHLPPQPVVVDVEQG